MTEKELMRQISGVLEDYGLWQEAKFKPWTMEIKNNFLKDFLLIAKRYAKGGGNNDKN